MILENKDLKEALKKSKTLIKGHKEKDYLKLLGIEILFFVLYIVVISLGILILIAISKLLQTRLLLESILLTVAIWFLTIALLIFSILSNAISYSFICRFYYQHKQETKESDTTMQIEPCTKEQNTKARKIMLCFTVLALAGGSLFVYLHLTGKTNLNIESMKTVEITAHRGASKNYPENTMAAFEGASLLGTDWIELDVQQTKDGEIVVSHDMNLMRTAGINKDIIDLTYDELKEIDVGSFFKKEYKDERIPLLQDVLRMAWEKNLRLNIEIKPSGREVDFEQKVVDLIRKYYFEERCVVASQSYEVLETIKKIDSNVKTVYVTSIALGNMTKLEAADIFSVESFNASKTLVKRIHNNGKEIWVWTVNAEENMQKMMELGVDNIITDDVITCRKLMIENRNSDYITQLIKKIQ